MLVCEWLYHVQRATEVYPSHYSVMTAALRLKEGASEREKRSAIQIQILH